MENLGQYFFLLLCFNPKLGLVVFIRAICTWLCNQHYMLNGHIVRDRHRNAVQLSGLESLKMSLVLTYTDSMYYSIVVVYSIGLFHHRTILRMLNNHSNCHLFPLKIPIQICAPIVEAKHEIN